LAEPEGRLGIAAAHITETIRLFVTLSLSEFFTVAIDAPT
jgi:hypothetical protein